MKTLKLIHILFLALVAVVMSACVPKATETKAACGVNQAFNNVTRSCYSIVAPNKAPVAANISPVSFNEDTQSIITLSYSDVDIDLATACALTSLSNITVTQSCSCDVAGVCTVGVTGTSNYFGAAQFAYTVKTNNMVSNSALANFTIAAVNDGPSISAIAAQSTNEDTAKWASFTIADIDSTLSCAASVSVLSNSDAVLLPSVIISGTAPNCTVTMTPAANAFGASNITLLVTDGALSATSAFTLTVNAVNDLPTISFISNPATVNEDNPASVSFTLSDVETTMDCTATHLSAATSNTLLIPSINIVFGGTYPNCTATMTPLADQNGTSNITITVTDLTASVTSNAFTTTIAAVNDAPLISLIADQSTAEDVATAIAFTINDIDNTLVCATNVTVTTNSNPTLASSVVVSGTAPNCVVTVTPAANQSGVSNLELTLSDGALSVAEPFQLTVTFVDDAPYLSSSIITADTNEGGIVVAGPFKINEDQGNTIDENPQTISISSIVSDNGSILTSASNPNATSTIRIFYDLNDNGVEDTNEERDLNEMLEDAPGDDAHEHAFYLKLYPVAGIAGNANLTITMGDGFTNITTNFSLIVHPVAALHGGWSNISAVGIKTDKKGLPVSVNDIECNANLATDIKACDTNQECTGEGAPHGDIVPDAVNVLFWDTANNKCYRSQSTSKFSWVDVTTTCPVTRIFVNPTSLTTAITATDVAMSVASTTGFPVAGVITIGTEQISYTGKTATTFTGLTRGVNSTTAAIHAAAVAISYTANGENFIKDLLATPSQGTPVATAKDQYYLDSATKACYSSTETAPGVWGWNATPFIPSKIKLSWNAFTIAGSGPDISVQVYGWNVYRREKDKDYDFTTGYLKANSADTMTISDAAVRTFTDTTAVAGKVYYYLVRPVDSTVRHLSVSTPEIFSEVRVLAPTQNYSFVHRWMVNQEVCNSMHMTTSTTNKVDPTKNYRCPYSGPGQVTISGTNYYDIGKDLLVDISENGCPYTIAPACSSVGCVGIGDPTSLGVTGMNINNIFYDRSSGSCSIYNGAAWLDYNTAGAALIAAASANVNTAVNAPLVNLSKTQAALVCGNRSTASATANLGIANGAVANAATAHSLPSKKEYIAYSAGPEGFTDSVLTDLEQGFSLNIQSRCNASGANGLEAAYTDSIIPSTSFIYSLPGTSSSGIRSLYTGSIPWVNNFSTETCSSRYGIQDIYGNVSEWVKDSMTCNVLINTTLSAPITAAVTTITVSSTADFAAAGTISIGSEEMTYTGKTATTFTGVTRGANSTTAEAHIMTELVYNYGATANNFLCKTNGGASGTDLERFDYSTDLYNDTPVNSYAFDLVTGPYNDVNASTSMSLGDGFLANWDYRDELFGAGKFSFPMGMPMYVDIASSTVSASAAIAYLLDIGPTSGITTNQLHEDGIIVSGAAVNDKTSNPTQVGSFAQGGSYLSGNFAGRYSSELVPDADVRPDIGFRCFIPVESTNFPADPGRHTYSY